MPGPLDLVSLRWNNRHPVGARSSQAGARRAHDHGVPARAGARLKEAALGGHPVQRGNCRCSLHATAVDREVRDSGSGRVVASGVGAASERHVGGNEHYLRWAATSCVSCGRRGPRLRVRHQDCGVSDVLAVGPVRRRGLVDEIGGDLCSKASSDASPWRVVPSRIEVSHGGCLVKSELCG